MEATYSPLRIAEVEQRQDEVLCALDELNARLERALAEYQRQFKLISGDTSPVLTSASGESRPAPAAAAP